MAKLSKSQLKEIVKECLVEILAEGLATSGASHLLSPGSRTTKTRRRKRATKPSRAPNTVLESTSYAPRPVDNQAPEPHEGFEEAVNNTVGSLTADPMMAAIFADTARTTLQEQTGHDTAPGHASGVETVAPGKDISEIDVFSDSSKNWASIAFAGETTNGND
jgi:hypothetical protein